MKYFRQMDLVDFGCPCRSDSLNEGEATHLFLFVFDNLLLVNDGERSPNRPLYFSQTASLTQRMTFVVTTSAANMWISQTKQSKQSCNSMQFPHFYLGPPTSFVIGTYITEATLVVKPELPPECKPGSPRKPKIHWPEDGALPKGDAKKKHWDMTHFQTAILQQYSSHVGSGFSVRSLEFS